MTRTMVKALNWHSLPQEGIGRSICDYCIQSSSPRKKKKPEQPNDKHPKRTSPHPCLATFERMFELYIPILLRCSPHEPIDRCA